MTRNEVMPPKPSIVPAAVGAWLAYVVADFLLHAVLLAAWWRATESYWLPPLVLFQRIPFAYAAFAIYTTFITWLIIRVIGPRPSLTRSLRLAAIAGTAAGSASALANYSVFAMPTSTLLVWPVSVIIGSLAAATAGAAILNTARPWRRVLAVVAVAFVLLALGVLLQNTLFPASPQGVSQP